MLTIEQKIFSKLEPHARRIKEGEGNDFDYLPAVLLQLMEEQKRHAKLLDDNANKIASVQQLHFKQINENLSAIGLQIESHSRNSQRFNVYFKRLLIAGLVASAAMVGLAVAILQRH